MGVLEQLKSGKVCVVHHNDADGICSAALLAITMKKLGNFPTKIISPKFTEFDDSIIKEVGNSDLTVILDMGLDKTDLEGIGDYLIIDHHPLHVIFEPTKLIHSTKNCASYLTFHFCNQFVKLDEYAWIAGIGCLADKDLDGFQQLHTFIKKSYPDLNESILRVMMCFISSSRIFGQKGLQYGVNALIEAAEMKSPTTVLGSTPNSQKLVRLRRLSIAQRNYWLMKFNEIAQIDYQNRILSAEISSKFFIQNYLAGTISNLYPSFVCFVINSGLDDKYSVIEVRSKSDHLNLGLIMKKACSYFENSSGGGHRQAAGAKVPKAVVKEFLEKVKEIMQIERSAL
ncbi:MAG: DHHA1 domain-containing protein [Candidatus Nanoarchaeia archaeon]|nr:DHHA1 domain-containing protein [Candidatus Haiyanarchaeum thermophilum]MCW1302832.1 DHHA1 domain-containing protein [Candidatus Haiyanarchaeum thermophilum]MCW1303513.1 DHHA1 domain-containing protein [Candidatus Haiyanarchaeum thermophilum]MCW1306693.1 DHHA1 domain-containing protein [Candidatus Haiyanarchaeum thermophilum]MCW1307351.1 DHHA1 domain-containing protein [Candidatus Haiyanarchaeum thermophilum]